MTSSAAPAGDVRLALNVVMGMQDCATKHWGSLVGRSDSLRDRLISKPPVFSEMANSAYLQNKPVVNMMTARQWIHGPPVNKGTPTLRPLFAARADITLGTFTIHVVLLDESVGASEPLRGATWRYEQPSWIGQAPAVGASANLGTHDFYHCQYVNDYGLRWLHGTNESQPSFPLAAESALELAVCAWTSVYGLAAFLDLRRYIPHSEAKSKADKWYTKYHCPSP